MGGTLMAVIKSAGDKPWAWWYRSGEGRLARCDEG
jgi:hypothetical protein